MQPPRIVRAHAPSESRTFHALETLGEVYGRRNALPARELDLYERAEFEATLIALLPQEAGEPRDLGAVAFRRAGLLSRARAGGVRGSWLGDCGAEFGIDASLLERLRPTLAPDLPVHPLTLAPGVAAEVLGQLGPQPDHLRFIALMTEALFGLRRPLPMALTLPDDLGAADAPALTEAFACQIEAAAQAALVRLRRHQARADLLAQAEGRLAPRLLAGLRAILQRDLDEVAQPLTARAYRALTRVPPATATRDLLALERAGVLQRSAQGGRATSYLLRAFL